MPANKPELNEQQAALLRYWDTRLSKEVKSSSDYKNCMEFMDEGDKAIRNNNPTAAIEYFQKAQEYALRLQGQLERINKDHKNAIIKYKIPADNPVRMAVEASIFKNRNNLNEAAYRITDIQRLAVSSSDSSWREDVQDLALDRLETTRLMPSTGIKKIEQERDKQEEWLRDKFSQLETSQNFTDYKQFMRAGDKAISEANRAMDAGNLSLQSQKLGEAIANYTKAQGFAERSQNTSIQIATNFKNSSLLPKTDPLHIALDSMMPTWTGYYNNATAQLELTKDKLAEVQSSLSLSAPSSQPFLKGFEHAVEQITSRHTLPPPPEVPESSVSTGLLAMAEMRARPRLDQSAAGNSTLPTQSSEAVSQQAGASSEAKMLGRLEPERST